MAKRDVSMFGLFVSPTGKGKALRYGSMARLGEVRDYATGETTIKTSLVVAIPKTELLRCGQAYERQISEGALVRRTAEDFIAYIEADEQPAEAPAKHKKDASAVKAGNKDKD